MFQAEWTGLLYSYLYALGILGLGEVLYRVADVPQFYARKFVHVAAGMWVFGIMMLFHRWYIGIIPFASFIVVNAIIWRYRLSKAVEPEHGAPGTAYFALAITLLFAVLWRPIGPDDYGPIAAAGAMALTWGDAMAAISGRLFGRHAYTVAGTMRTLEGSAVMFGVSFVTMLLVLLLLPGSFIAQSVTPLPLFRALFAALLGAAAATAAEAVTPRGLDNLSVPIAAAGVVWLVVAL